MRIINDKALDKLSRKHADVRGALRAWRSDVALANWKTPIAVKERYPSADILSNNCVVFNLKGNHYRIIVKIRYDRGFVRICFAGTHAEYDRIDANSVC